MDLDYWLHIETGENATELPYSAHKLRKLHGGGGDAGELLLFEVYEITVHPAVLNGGSWLCQYLVCATNSDTDE